MRNFRVWVMGATVLAALPREALSAGDRNCVSLKSAEREIAQKVGEKREQAKRARVCSIPEGAPASDAIERTIEAMSFSGENERKMTVLVELCGASCQNLSAAAIGRILLRVGPEFVADVKDYEGIGTRLHPEGPYFVDFQREALKRAALPWRKISEQELVRSILPNLQSDNIALAFEKWREAHKAR